MYPTSYSIPNYNGIIRLSHIYTIYYIGYSILSLKSNPATSCGPWEKLLELREESHHHGGIVLVAHETHFWMVCTSEDTKAKNFFIEHECTFVRQKASVTKIPTFYCLLLMFQPITEQLSSWDYWLVDWLIERLVEEFPLHQLSGRLAYGSTIVYKEEGLGLKVLKIWCLIWYFRFFHLFFTMSNQEKNGNWSKAHILEHTYIEFIR